MIQSKIRDGVHIVIPVGNLKLHEGNQSFRRKIDSLLEDDVRKILLDLSKVIYVDSSGVGELLRAKNRIEEVEGILKLVCTEGPVKIVLQMTRVYGIFEVFESEDLAIESDWK